MKYLTEISETKQSLRYNKLMMQQKAHQILSKNGNSKGKDNLSISNTARSFSKESIVALVDSSVNITKNQVSFYLNNYNNMSALLDAINFGENVSCGYNPEFKEYGVFYFDYKGSSQIIPNYAVPKMNAGALSPIRAVNNSLVLSNKSYYSWTASNGSRYTWTVHNGRMGWALSEELLSVPAKQKGTNYAWEMQKASTILSNLARGETWDVFREDVLPVCASVGIKPGFFSVEAGSGVHHYILQESGRIINVDKEIERLNSRNWIRAGFKEGETVSVYGNDYIVDSSGHINVSAEDTFTSTEITYYKQA